jgi:hypothetical protein
MSLLLGEEPGMSARRRQGVIRLKADQFDLITRVLKCDSDEARARLINVSAKSIYRARRGGLGQQLIAQTLINLRDRHDELAKYNLIPSFDELFEVVDVNAEPCHPDCPAFVVDATLGRHR